MQKFLTILSLTAMLLMVGCSTVKGVGKDITSLGKTIEKEADK